jgi:hypothetical protein
MKPSEIAPLDAVPMMDFHSLSTRVAENALV